MKYIVLRRNWHSFIQECPIIFPEEFNHPDMLDAIKMGIPGMEAAVLVSAGFINILNAPHCFGGSPWLKSASRGAVDSNRIREYINDRGVIDWDMEAQA